jgi:hypothetical protein
MSRISWKSRFASLLDCTSLSGRDQVVIEDMWRGYDRKGSSYMTAGRKRYFLSIEERAQKAAQALAERKATGATSDLGKRLEDVDSRIGDRSSWAAGFIESLITQDALGRDLSPRQVEILDKIDREHSAEAAASAASFAERYQNDAEGMKTNFSRCLSYYATTQYYGRQVLAFRNDPNYVPTLKEWRKIVENKFAAKVIAGYEAAPKYPQASTVYAGANAPYGARKALSRGGFVVATSEAILSACKGNKRYTVLPIGGVQTIFIEERHLKGRK